MRRPISSLCPGSLVRVRIASTARSVKVSTTQLLTLVGWVHYPCRVMAGKSYVRIIARRHRCRQEDNLRLRRLLPGRFDERPANTLALVFTADCDVGKVCHVGEVRDAPGDTHKPVIGAADDYQVGVAYHLDETVRFQDWPTFAETRRPVDIGDLTDIQIGATGPFNLPSHEELPIG